MWDTSFSEKIIAVSEAVCTCLYPVIDNFSYLRRRVFVLSTFVLIKGLAAIHNDPIVSQTKLYRKAQFIAAGPYWRGDNLDSYLSDHQYQEHQDCHQFPFDLARLYSLGTHLLPPLLCHPLLRIVQVVQDYPVINSLLCHTIHFACQ